MNASSETRPEISVVIPVVERTGDLRLLVDEYCKGVKALGKSAEFVFVVDDRQRESLPVLKEIQRASDAEITLIALGGSFGESTSLMVGVRHARGDVILTLPSYFQVEIDRIPEAVAMVEKEGIDLVVGVRDRSDDSFFNRLQSKGFHVLLNRLCNSDFGDVSCGFRVMRKGLVDELKIYGGLHRFIPILAKSHGFRVEEIGLDQRREDTSLRYYGLALYLKRVVDVLAVFFLTNFTQRPMRLFGPLGLTLSLIGGGITLYLGIFRLLEMGSIADRPLLIFGVLLIVLGIQLLSIGMVGEIVVFTHSRQVMLYRVAEIIGSGEGSDTVTSGSEMRAPESL